MLQIQKGARGNLSTSLMRNLLGAAAYDASDTSGELLFCGVGMAHKIVARIANGMLHQVMCEVSIIQVGPRAQKGVAAGSNF